MQSKWFISPEIAAQISALSPEVIAQAYASAQAHAPTPANIATREGSTAVIPIRGVLYERVHPIAKLLGLDATAYSDIREAIANAEKDSSVREIRLDVSSPGGSVDGLYPTLEALASARKPITVHAHYAASAAYFLAAASGGRILATSPASEIGSIGVAVSIYTSPERVELANTASPNKRPDVSTEEGRRAVQDELDGVFVVHAELVTQGRSRALGRPYTMARLTAPKGATLVAKAALEAGLIDGFVPSASPGSSASASASASAPAPTEALGAFSRFLLQRGPNAPVAPEPAPVAPTPESTGPDAWDRIADAMMLPPAEPADVAAYRRITLGGAYGR